jgi:hypothetical protein
VKITSAAAINTLFGGFTNALTFYINTSQKLVLGKSEVADATQSTTAIGTGAYRSIGFKYDGSNVTYFLNSATDGVQAFAPGGLASVTELGVYDAPGGGFHWFGGQMCELLYYGEHHSAAQSRKVFNYLNLKYGV